MPRRAVFFSGSLLVALMVLGISFVLAMRAQSPRVISAVRRANRAVFNPRVMTSAGATGARASVVRHRGRVSGRRYETPVGAVPTEDGFVVALPYGLHADWVRNVLADGEADVVHGGQTHGVESPEIVTMREAAPHFPANEQRTHRIFGIEQFLRVRRSGSSPPVAPPLES